MAKLVVISDPNRVYELNDEKVTVGRLTDNLISLEDDAISSYHAELNRNGAEYIVRDLNSTNGTRVNGQRIVESNLTHGDTVHFGLLELQYLSAVNGAARPLPAANKKLVDLSSTSMSIKRSTSFTNTSPFAKQKGKHNKVFFLVLGALILVSLVMVGFVIYRILHV